jgi:hypothetical protein
MWPSIIKLIAAGTKAMALRGFDRIKLAEAPVFGVSPLVTPG